LAWTEYKIVTGSEVPPTELIVIQGTLLEADFAQREGVPVILKLPLLLPAAANAAELLRLTAVHVCACNPKPRNSAAKATRKLITNDEPRN
jgi:hypothetical protein